MSDGVRTMWMRGGTSKGGYFLHDDLPQDEPTRDAVLMSVMGSPDTRQIDGMGGADPLTSKVALVRKSDRDGIDVDYLFLQVFVDQPIVTDAQNCGNILAGVAPFAIERNLVPARNGDTPVTIYMENTGQTAVVLVSTPGGAVNYSGDAKIDGVPGSAAPVPIEFKDTAGSSCGALLPTGNVQDLVEGIKVTMVDNGMPCVVLRAEDMGISGSEAPEELEQNAVLVARLEAIRLACGPMMNLGDVTKKSVPKMTMVSAPENGGAIATRTFIPHRCHKAIGVLGAVSVATACLMKGSTAYDLAKTGKGNQLSMAVEHPSGEMTVVASLNETGDVVRAAILRTARKLMDGKVFP
ncbi:MAG: 4-oxalomesaconate tautomerase [Planktomarina sp.]|nr:4-oxalomesaconate tautomerase [Planktomarina sp.]MDT2033842.1 4-oxalomesaconate tautomerase [Planktomarina sp.]MDT2039741.1 4-oxalomesaconate tautomerase [Planktomarina sp.]MDT2050078.1 4-oxalomesaconate tautomerase [Planktomarina sp.]|tara:strand:- start:659 stop:1714 length:1056 start_codon:yes stop_codon:yes gene_type:complete